VTPDLRARLVELLAEALVRDLQGEATADHETPGTPTAGVSGREIPATAEDVNHGAAQA
jgi:hypothetical protein